MKKKYLLVLILFLNIQLINCQDRFINLEKYNNYRERFFKDFIAVSDGDEKGSNYPAMSTDGKTLFFGDGNGGLQYYIGWLATEYRLQQLYGQDLYETSHLLQWALEAVERLNTTAENYFRVDKVYDLRDYNGLLVRDDVDDKIKLIFPNNPYFSKYKHNLSKYENIFSQYVEQIPYLPNNYANIGDFEASKDVIWNYLINLALVTALVDDPYITDKARWIAYKMVAHMRYSDGWYIKNPVTGTIINNGDGGKDGKDGRGTIDEVGGLTGMSYGFAESANFITKQEWGSLDWQDALSDGNKFLFQYGLAFATYHDKGTYSYKSFMTVGNINGIFGTPVFNTLCLDEPSDEYYIHLPLIYLLLHGRGIVASPFPYEDPISPISRSPGEYILDDAPYCGTNSNEPGTSWCHDNWLIWKEKDNRPNIEYNGIDYMLFHNLMWLVHYIPFNENITLGGSLPDTYHKLVSPGVPPVFEYVNYGNDNLPLVKRATNTITCNTVLHSDANLKLYANRIVLSNGFKAELNSKFIAVGKLNDGSVPDFVVEESNCESSNSLVLNQNKSLADTNLNIQKSAVYEAKYDGKSTNSSDLLNKINTIKIGPNPVSDRLYISNPSKLEIKSIEIHDLTGRILFKSKNAELIIDVSFLQKGNYIIKICTINTNISNKFIKI